MPGERPGTYEAFWPLYLRAHRKRATRVCHYVGSVLALLMLGAFLVRPGWGWLLAALLLGYGCAWLAHGLIERNRPATFGHPLWSLYSDYRMLALAVRGRLAPHLRAAGIAPSGPEG